MIADSGVELTHGVTLGMGQVLGAKRILLLVNGEHKRAVLRKVLSEEVSDECPGTLLRDHGDVICVCDEAALGSD